MALPLSRHSSRTVRRHRRRCTISRAETRLVPSCSVRCPKPTTRVRRNRAKSAVVSEFRRVGLEDEEDGLISSTSRVRRRPSPTPFRIVANRCEPLRDVAPSCQAIEGFFSHVGEETLVERTVISFLFIDIPGRTHRDLGGGGASRISAQS